MFYILFVFYFTTFEYIGCALIGSIVNTRANHVFRQVYIYHGNHHVVIFMYFWIFFVDSLAFGLVLGNYLALRFEKLIIVFTERTLDAKFCYWTHSRCEIYLLNALNALKLKFPKNLIFIISTPMINQILNFFFIFITFSLILCAKMLSNIFKFFDTWFRTLN